MAGFEPAFSSTPSWRIARLSHILSKPVPAAGIEPAASAFSARRSHRLSYTGINQRRRQESNLLRCRVAADRLAVRPRRHLSQEPRAGGETRTHWIRVTRAVPGPSDSTGKSEQPVLVSSQLDRGSEPPSPAEGLAGSRSCRSRTCPPGFVDPALESARQPPVPHARVELANPPSEGRCLLHKTGPRSPSDQGGTRSLTPGGHGLLRTACLPVPPPGQSSTMDRGGS